MIGKLSGTVDSLFGSQVIIDVHGVGYTVTCSANTLRKLHIHEATQLHIETQVREDAINLFGFLETAEQGWFKLLTTVQGVGAKVALSILGHIPADKLAQVIAAQDKTALTEADGVGPKLALRLVTELKDKTLSFGGGFGAIQHGASPKPLGAIQSHATDAVSALVNLGYRRVEAFAAITNAGQQRPDAKIDELIRLGLQELSRKETAA